ncbi:hypothetical protein ONS96_003468 [Cadophora gregata f. sp. sojae]|nr:hypothetical protein ONS96_003468 [Cadophora gregata f. sp. sojae]
MNFYDSAFLLLVTGCGLLSWRQYYTGEKSPEEKSSNHSMVTPRAKAEASQFTRLFLTVYCLVMGSDWLQGPYVYSLYKDQFGLPERTVAALFTTGFLSGGISGYFVGQFADRYGRKTACLVFCITYSIACLSTLIPSVPALFFGRVFGGLSTSLMYSAFESWMVTEYHKRQMDKAGSSLSGMYGIVTTLNSIVAILSGVFSEWLVNFTHTKRAPFMAGAALLMVAFWIILVCWVSGFIPSLLSNMYLYSRRPRITATVTHPLNHPLPQKMPSKPASQTNASLLSGSHLAFSKAACICSCSSGRRPSKPLNHSQNPPNYHSA